MAPYDTAQLGDRPILTAEIRRARMAKADLRKPEEGPSMRAGIGRAIERTRTRCQLSLKEFAAVIGRDERQVARWIAGTERPQFDALFGCVALRGALVIALAELAEEADIVTTITIRRAG